MGKLSVVGRIHFREYSSPLSHLGGAAAPAPLTILLSGCPTPLGFIDFGEYFCRIGGKDYGSTFTVRER